MPLTCDIINKLDKWNLYTLRISNFRGIAAKHLLATILEKFVNDSDLM
jgi:hypothetical protein